MMKHIQGSPAPLRSLPLASVALILGLTTLPANAQDALLESAVPSTLSPHTLLMDIDRVGQRLVAVGERGHILISSDDAQSWRQAQVPVRVTLTASYFVDDTFGWAVGHDGVVLRTDDGGESWRKVLDGYQANQIGLDHALRLQDALEHSLANAPEDQQAGLEEQLETLTMLSEDAESFAAEGPSRPFLDLWFKNRLEGFAVGAFGLFMHTRDGGESWEAWFDHLDNPYNFHLNAIRQVGDHLYIAAEAGTLYRSSDWGESWQLLESPYDGSFFGVVGSADGRIIAYGLRGHAFQSRDWGDSWLPLDTGVDSGLFGATLLDDGTAVLVGDAGVSVYFAQSGVRTGHHQTAQRLPLSNVIAGGDKGLLTVGLPGIQHASVTGGSH